MLLAMCSVMLLLKVNELRVKSVHMNRDTSMWLAIFLCVEILNNMSSSEQQVEDMTRIAQPMRMRQELVYKASTQYRGSTGRSG
mgnify:CR=1 FL=1